MEKCSRDEPVRASSAGAVVCVCDPLSEERGRPAVEERPSRCRERVAACEAL